MGSRDPGHIVRTMSRAQQCEQQISVTMLMKAATLQLLSFKFTLATVRVSPVSLTDEVEEAKNAKTTSLSITLGSCFGANPNAVSAHVITRQEPRPQATTLVLIGEH